MIAEIEFDATCSCGRKLIFIQDSSWCRPLCDCECRKMYYLYFDFTKGYELRENIHIPDKNK